MLWKIFSICVWSTVFKIARQFDVGEGRELLRGFLNDFVCFFCLTMALVEQVHGLQEGSMNGR